MSAIADNIENKVQTAEKAALFDEMVHLNKGILFKVANTYCTTEDDKKDLVQEIMIQLWRAFERYDSRYKISTWMYSIALNVAISFNRKRLAQNKWVVPMGDLAENIVELELQDKEQQLKLLEQFINELKELDKALMLLYLDEKSHKEMAEILGITETNVATKIGRIKEKLRDRFIRN
jgi:RNA polymerase sigma factor (sigma-70 family)